MANVPVHRKSEFSPLFFLVVLFAIAFAIAVLNAIFDNNSSELAPIHENGEINLGYSPPLLPLTFEINTKGEVTVNYGGRIVTPVGTFTAEWEREDIYYLEVTLGQQTRFYPLGERPFKLDLPNSLEGKSRVSYDGDRYIRIIIPNPGAISFP